MTMPTTTERRDARDLIYAARYYLARSRVLLILATIAIVAGLVLNWNWLVAAGLAPILISTLPCLVMCVFGVCMMCRSSEEQSVPIRDAAGAASPLTTLAVAATDKSSTGTNSATSASQSVESEVPTTAPEAKPAAGVAGCCQGMTNEGRSEQTIDLQSNRERRDPHA